MHLHSWQIRLLFRGTDDVPIITGEVLRRNAREFLEFPLKMSLIGIIQQVNKTGNRIGRMLHHAVESILKPCNAGVHLRGIAHGIGKHAGEVAFGITDFFGNVPDFHIAVGVTGKV